MNRTMAPNLPPEVIDFILNHLYADHRMLLTCALICRTWVPMSRHILFQTFRCKPLTSANCTHFLNIIHAPHATFPDHLRSLHVCGDGTGYTPFSAEAQYQLNHTLGSLGVLKAVVALTFTQLRWESIDRYSAAALLAAFSGVRCLKFDRFRCASAGVLYSIIYAFPSLKILDGDHIDVDERGQIYALPRPFTPPVSVLRLDGSLPWCLQPTNFFVRALGAHLEHLVYIGHTFAPHSLSPGGYPEIEENVRLRSVRFGNLNLSPFSPIVTPITVILRGVTEQHTALREIFVELRVTETQVAGCSGWSELDILLKEPQFARVTKLEVILSFHRNSALPDHGVTAGFQLACGALRRCLPSCYERGILHARLCIFTTENPIVVASCKLC